MKRNELAAKTKEKEADVISNPPTPMSRGITTSLGPIKR